MRLVYKKSWKIQQCWCINGFYEATITGCIYLVEPWWRKPYLITKVIVPYLPSPTYDGEYATNKYLAIKEIEINAELEIQKDNINRRLNRYFKRRKL